MIKSLLSKPAIVSVSFSYYFVVLVGCVSAGAVSRVVSFIAAQRISLYRSFLNAVLAFFMLEDRWNSEWQLDFIFDRNAAGDATKREQQKQTYASGCRNNSVLYVDAACRRAQGSVCDSSSTVRYCVRANPRL